MSWFEHSIMARKGVAKGKPGAKHEITEATQGKYHYIYGPYAKPVLTVDPGAVVSCETHDAFEGAIKHETDKPSEMLNFPFLNPQNGPIFVNGAEKGDCLAVYIKSIVPRGPQPVGTTALMPEFGGLVGTGDHGAPQQAAARTGEEDRGDGRGRRQVERQDHAALRAVHRHHRHIAGDRGDLVARSGLLRRQHGPAGRRARRRDLSAGQRARAGCSISATAMRSRATANCAASRSSIRP